RHRLCGSGIPGAKCIPIRSARFLQDRSFRDRSHQGKLFKCGAMPIERDSSWANEPSQLSTAAAKPLRATFQPPDEFCRLPEANRDCKRPRASRALERRSPEGDDLYNSTRRKSCDVFFCGGNGTAFSVALFARVDP